LDISQQRSVGKPASHIEAAYIENLPQDLNVVEKLNEEVFSRRLEEV